MIPSGPRRSKPLAASVCSARAVSIGTVMVWDARTGTRYNQQLPASVNAVMAACTGTPAPSRSPGRDQLRRIDSGAPGAAYPVGLGGEFGVAQFEAARPTGERVTFPRHRLINKPSPWRDYWSIRDRAGGAEVAPGARSRTGLVRSLALRVVTELHRYSHMCPPGYVCSAVCRFRLDPVVVAMSIARVRNCAASSSRPESA